MQFLSLFLQRLSNGSIDSTDETSQIVELQELLEKQNYEMAQMKERLAALSSRVGEVEQEAETARKDRSSYFQCQKALVLLTFGISHSVLNHGLLEVRRSLEITESNP